MALEKGIFLLVESIGIIKKLSSTNFSNANIPISSSKTPAVLTCSVEQHLSNSKGSIIHLVQLNNIQGFNIDRYDFTSSPTDDIPFSFIILESNSLRTKYLLDHTNKIVTEDTANLENKDVIASSSSFDCNNYSINLQTFNMKFKVITEVTPVPRSKVLFFSSGNIFRDNNDNYIKKELLV